MYESIKYFCVGSIINDDDKTFIINRIDGGLIYINDNELILTVKEFIEFFKFDRVGFY